MNVPKKHSPEAYAEAWRRVCLFYRKCNSSGDFDELACYLQDWIRTFGDPNSLEDDDE